MPIHHRVATVSSSDEDEDEQEVNTSPEESSSVVQQSETRVYLTPQGGVDYVALALNVGLPLVTSGVLLYLSLKDAPGGAVAALRSMSDPETEMKRFVSSLNALKETLLAARSSQSS